MPLIVEALVPVLVLIAIGYGLRRAGFPGDGFWRPAARTVYFVFLPALLLRIIALAQLDPQVWRAQVVAVLTVCAVTILLLLTRKRVSSSGPKFTSVVQGSVRHNTYIGLAIAGAVFTSDEVAVFALIVAVVVPLVNAISVAVLGRYGSRSGEDGRLNSAQTLKLVAVNPLIVACAIGAVLNVSGVGLPSFVGDVFQMLARPALPLGLLVVGAGLQLRALVNISREMVIPLLLRLVLYPALALGLALWLGLPNYHLAPLMLLASLPTAASAFVLAVELGGDEDLMACIITMETIAAAVTIPTVLWVALQLR